MARRNPPSVPGPTIPKDEVERKCWNCRQYGMQPHEPVFSHGTSEPGQMWFFKCPNCGARFQWVLGSTNEHKHKVNGTHSASSMLSDPDCTVFTLEQQMEANKPGKDADPTIPMFVYDEHDNKTHRWHYGRGEWVKIGERRR